MGVDEALLASAVRTGRPSLRFYRWQGPWLSLGYGQVLDRERVADCSRAGVGVVRRVTGGRAVLHGSDLTYALAAREGQLPPGLMASYELVAGVLIRALGALGVEAVASGPPRRGETFQHRFQVDPGRAVSRSPGDWLRLFCPTGWLGDLCGWAKARGKRSASRQRWHFTARFDSPGARIRSKHGARRPSVAQERQAWPS